MKLMKRKKGVTGYYTSPKSAEIALQDEIEFILKENEIDLSWWVVLDNYSTVRDIFTNYLAIYQYVNLPETSPAFLTKFLRPYVSYYNKVVDSVNDWLMKNVKK